MTEKFSIKTVVERELDFTYFDGPMTAKYWPGAPESKLLVVTGDNSSGKSFFGKLFAEVVLTGDYGKIEVMRISMQHRTGQGMAKVLIFGDESYRATGAISAHTVSNGISTCRNREHDHILFLDEPDIGLAESYQGALGKLIAEFAKNLPEKTKALCIITHSRRIVRHLAPLNPHYLRIGDELSMQEFLVEQPDKEIADIEGLADLSQNRFRAIQDCIDTGLKEREREREEERKKAERKERRKKKKSEPEDGCEDHIPHSSSYDWRNPYRDDWD